MDAEPDVFGAGIFAVHSTQSEDTLSRSPTRAFQRSSTDSEAPSSKANKRKTEPCRRGVQHSVSDPLVSVHSKHRVLRSRRVHTQEDSWLARFISHPRFETFGGFIVLFNFMIMTMETQAAATDDVDLKSFVNISNKILLLYYTAECAVRLYISRYLFFASTWNNLDFTIVVTGWLGETFELISFDGAGVENMTMLKGLRMLRMMRLVRLVVAFRELYRLVAGIGRCMKTLCWASCLIFMILNIWAIVSVEFLDEKVKALVPTGSFKTCGWCENAFANVWQANLTWFQIISTADWTAIGRPLAEHFVWPYAFFVFNVFIVLWGVLNLIVAAIIESNLAARDDDVDVAATTAALHQEDSWAYFADICKGMDVDSSGDISIEEFKDFLSKNELLQQHLTIMGVREGDLDELLELMDDNGNGLVEVEEFIANFSRMRTLVEKTSLFFLLKFVKDIREKLNQQNYALRHMWNDISRASEARSSEAVIHRESERDPQATRHTQFQESSPVSHAMPDITGLPHGWYFFGSCFPTTVEASQKSDDSNDQLPSQGAHAPEDLLLQRLSTIFKEISSLATHGVSLAAQDTCWEPVATERLPFQFLSPSHMIPPTPTDHILADLQDGVLQNCQTAGHSKSSSEAICEASLQVHDVQVSLLSL